MTELTHASLARQRNHAAGLCCSPGCSSPASVRHVIARPWTPWRPWRLPRVLDEAIYCESHTPEPFPEVYPDVVSRVGVLK